MNAARAIIDATSLSVTVSVLAFAAVVLGYLAVELWRAAAYVYRTTRQEMREDEYDVACKLVRNTKSYRRQKERRRKQGNDREFTVGAPKFNEFNK